MQTDLYPLTDGDKYANNFTSVSLIVFSFLRRVTLSRVVVRI